MTDWNNQAAANNNLPSKTLRFSKFVSGKTDKEFAEELSDGGERDQMIQAQIRKNRKD